MQTGIRACVAGGKVVIVGLGSEEAKIPISIAACKEIDILGSFRYCNTVRARPAAHGWPLAAWRCLHLVPQQPQAATPSSHHRLLPAAAPRRTP